MAKIEAGKLELNLERVDLAGTIEDAVRLLRDRAESRRRWRSTSRRTSVCPSLLADRRAVKQVVINLVSDTPIKFPRRPADEVAAICGDAEDSSRRASVVSRRPASSIPANGDPPRLGKPFEQVCGDPMLAKSGTGPRPGAGAVAGRAAWRRNGHRQPRGLGHRSQRDLPAGGEEARRRLERTDNSQIPPNTMMARKAIFAVSVRCIYWGRSNAARRHPERIALCWRRSTTAPRGPHREQRRRRPTRLRRATTTDGVLDQYKLSPTAKSDITRAVAPKIGKGGFAALSPRKRERACAGIEKFVDDLYARQHPHHHFGWHHSHNTKGPSDTEVKAALRDRASSARSGRSARGSGHGHHHHRHEPRLAGRAFKAASDTMHVLITINSALIGGTITFPKDFFAATGRATTFVVTAFAPVPAFDPWPPCCA